MKVIAKETNELRKKANMAVFNVDYVHYDGLNDEFTLAVNGPTNNVIEIAVLKHMFNTDVQIALQELATIDYTTIVCEQIVTTNWF